MKISREVRIGAFSIIIITLFIIGLNFIKGKDIFHKHRTYYAVFNAISGLQDAAPVQLNGLTIGKVTDIRFESKNSSKVLVELTVYNPIFIPSNSIARLNSSDILGTKNIELILGNTQIPALIGDTLKSELSLSLTEEVNRQVAPIKKKAEDLLSSLDTMVTVLHTVFNSETRRNLTESFARIRSTITNLESTSYNIDTLVYGQRKRMERIMFNIESITENIRENDENITTIISNFAAISDTLAKANIAKTITNVNVVLTEVSNITSKINSGEGSIGLLVNDKKLYNNLDKSSFELEQLIKDMKLNPHRYLNFSVFPPSKKRMEFKPEGEQ